MSVEDQEISIDLIVMDSSSKTRKITLPMLPKSGQSFVITNRSPERPVVINIETEQAGQASESKVENNDEIQQLRVETFKFANVTELKKLLELTAENEQLKDANKNCISISLHESRMAQLEEENKKLYAAHTEWSRNDCRTFGALLIENDKLRAEKESILKIGVEGQREINRKLSVAIAELQEENKRLQEQLENVGYEKRESHDRKED